MPSGRGRGVGSDESEENEAEAMEEKREERERIGVEICFADLYLQLLGPAQRPQLNATAAACRAGRLTAIMGPSGAGKTLLMSSIMGNVEVKRGGLARARVYVNGEPRDGAQFARLCAYVAQRDALPESSTVEEAVTLSAQLRLPKGMQKDRVHIVQRSIEEMGLLDVRKSLIGGVRSRGLSGGEMRRVSIAVEMVTDPSLLFLDEPTSGLDSNTAVSTMYAVSELARKGRTVVATIHQPNSDLVSLFDDLLLLANGRLVYYGPFKEAVAYFEHLGHVCPIYTLPTDFFLKVISFPDNLDALFEHYDSVVVPLLQEEFLCLTDKQPTKELSHVHGPKVQANWSTQVWLLSVRFTRIWKRDPMLFYAELIQYLVLAVFVGLMYLQVSDSLSNASIQDRAASLWFMLVVVCFTPPFSVLTVFETERFLLHKEHTGGWYSLSAYFMARTITTIPIELVLCFVFSVIAYFMVGLQSSASKFFIFYAAIALFQLISETLGLFSAVLVSTAAYGVLVLSLLLLLFLSFSGFLIASTPVYFRWLQKISFFNYAYSIVIQNEFDGLMLCCDEAGNPVNVEDEENTYIDDDNLSIANNFWVLLGMLVGWRLICYAVFRIKESKWLIRSLQNMGQTLRCCRPRP